MSHALTSSYALVTVIFHPLVHMGLILCRKTPYMCYHVCVCVTTCLLLVELPLYLLVITGVIDNGSGQLGLNVSKPRTQAAHVFVQLLHCYQGLPQLLHPGNRKRKSVSIQQLTARDRDVCDTQST